MLIPCFKGTISQRAGLKASFECCIFYRTERLFVELVNIELNAGFFTVRLEHDKFCSNFDVYSEHSKNSHGALVD